MNDSKSKEEDYNEDPELLEENEWEDEEIIEEEKPLTRSKLFLLIGLGAGLFLIFLVLLFPFEEVVKSYLTSFSKKSGVIVEFKDISFPIFGRKRVDSLAIQPGSDLLLKSEEMIIDVGILELINMRYDGEIGLSGFKYEGGETVFNIKSILFAGKLSGLDDRISKLTGDMTITLRGGEISSLPSIPFVGEVNGIKILKGQFRMKFRSGRMQIDMGNLNTSWLRIFITGNIRLMDNIGFSGLDLEICTVAQDKFAQERPDLAGMLVLLPQKNGRACIPIKGTFRSPKPEMPNMMGASPPTGLSDGSQNPNPDGNLGDPATKSSDPTKNAEESKDKTEEPPVVKDEESSDPGN